MSLDNLNTDTPREPRDTPPVTRAPQQLRFLPDEFVIDQIPAGAVDQGGVADDWLTMVRAPEGLTVVRRSAGADVATRERWSALYSGMSAHGLDVPGMLAAVVGPLADAEVPVFVASTFHADLVLVPVERAGDAAAALRAVGHQVQGEAHTPS